MIYNILMFEFNEISVNENSALFCVLFRKLIKFGVLKLSPYPF